MVGPLSSEEIEDVVTSVRRLVSNEQGPHRISRDLNAERLLLTPALRVVSELGPLSPLILDRPVPDPLAADAPPATTPVDGVTGAVGAATDPVSDDPEVELIEADWEDEIWSASEVASLGEVALGAEEAEVLMASVEEDAAGIVAEADDLPDSWAQVDSDWARDEPIPFIPLRRRAENLAARLAAGVVMDPSEADAGLVDDGHDEPDMAGEPSQAAAPDFTARSASDPEDDALAIDAFAEDHQPDATATQRMPTEILDADGIPLAVLDEAALQEIVRQMIREELQGSLGERITRNMRKLVRAEINRALVARDLD